MAANNSRRQLAHISIFGTTQLHLRHPWIVAWWSAAFPGFGHLLLSKYLRGFFLIAWEFFINTNVQFNEAMMYSFLGQFDTVKEILQLRWLSLYAPIYLFAIFDSYRTTVDMNNLYVLANHENAPIKSFRMNALETNYLDKRNPWVSVLWSSLMPGMGQLYIHRVITAIYVFIGWIFLVYNSKMLIGLHYTLLGDWDKITSSLNMEWFLYMPSIYGFAMYDAYTNTVENNKLFVRQQKQFLINEYQNKQFPMPSKT